MCSHPYCGGRSTRYNTGNDHPCGFAIDDEYYGREKFVARHFCCQCDAYVVPSTAPVQEESVKAKKKAARDSLLTKEEKERQQRQREEDQARAAERKRAAREAQEKAAQEKAERKKANATSAMAPTVLDVDGLDLEELRKKKKNVKSGQSDVRKLEALVGSGGVLDEKQRQKLSRKAQLEADLTAIEARIALLSSN